MIDRRSTLGLLAAAAILSSILGFCYGATFNGACATLKDAPFGCAEWWLSRYQTLIAMAGAIFAAWLGVQPVLRQLKLTSLQTSATLQQVYTAREKSLESGFAQERATLQKVSMELHRFLRDGGEDPEAWKEWVWAMNQEVDSLRTLLIQHQTRIRDGEETRIASRQLVAELENLSKCMRNFNATQGADDPELGPYEEVLAEAAEVERQAEEELPGRIEKAIKVLGGMRKAYAADIRAVRMKRQLHDQILSKAEVPEGLEN